MVFVKKLAKLEKRVRGFRAVALMLLAKWCAAVVELLHEELELVEWKELHVDSERSINYKHVHASLTCILQRQVCLWLAWM